MENGSAIVQDKSVALRDMVRSAFQYHGADMVSLFVNGISVWAIGADDVDEEFSAELTSRLEIAGVPFNEKGQLSGDILLSASVPDTGP